MEKINSFHLFSLGTTVMIFGVILNLPKGENSIFLLLLSLAAAYSGLLLVYLLIKQWLKTKQYVFKWVQIPIKILLSACLVCSGIYTFVCITRFTKIALLPKTAVFLIAMLLSLVIFTLLKGGVLTPYKLSLILFVPILGIIAVLFLLSLKQAEFSYLLTQSFNLSFSLIEFLRLSGKLLFLGLPCVILSVFAQKNCKINGLFYGFFLGGAALLLSLTQSIILTFSTNHSALPDYLYAISTVSVGNYYFRLDGFVWFTVFFSAVIQMLSTALALKNAFKDM